MILPGKEREEQNWYLSERDYGAFERSFAVPQGVDATAEFAKGVLTVTLPKSTQAQQQSKTIEIKAA